MLIFNKNKKLIYFLLIIIFILFLLIEFVYAKYESKVNGLLFSNVAIWNFKINGSTEKMQNINIFDTSEESSKTNGKIAPGTEGKFKIQIDATDSDVDIEYKFLFEDIGKKPNNIRFIYQDKEYLNLNEIEENLNGIIKANEGNKIRDIEIKWIWRYETGNSSEEIIEADREDTYDGMSIEQYNVNVTVIGSQINI